MAQIKFITPILSVRNVSQSIEYYVEKLGFRKSWDWGDPPAFGAVERDGVQIFFCKDAQGSPGTWMSVWVEDVDSLHEEFKSRGATIRQPPTNFPWGVREMNVQDLNGHRLRFSMGTNQPADGVALCEEP